MTPPRLASWLVTTVALATGTALADPPATPSGAPARPPAAPKNAKDAKQEAIDALGKLRGPAHLRKLSETRAERRREHRAELYKSWGGLLDRAEVLAELRKYAERTARLRRMRFVAETERTGAAREKILARIDELLEKENARHERAMQRFATAAGASSGSPPPAPAAASGAPAASSAAARPLPPMPMALPSGMKLPPPPASSGLPPGVKLPPIPGLSARPQPAIAPAPSGGKP